MKKISRKLVTSSLAMAFATVALGTTTFAWFTTNAQVTAKIDVAVQTTTDSILISDDCFSWGSSVNLDLSGTEMKPLTYVADSNSALSAEDDKFTTIEQAESNAGLIEFVLYLKVSSPEIAVGFNAATYDDAEVVNTTTSIADYSVLRNFDATYSNTGSNTALTTKAEFNTGDKIKVDAKNALRSVLDVSEPGDGSTSTYRDATKSNAISSAFGTTTLEYTRQNYVVGYVGEGTQPTFTRTLTDGVATGHSEGYTSGAVYNFGQGLSKTNAANSYIHEVLGTNFADTFDADADPKTYAADANYAALSSGTTFKTQYNSVTDALFTTEAGSSESIYALRFSYWLEGYDADCFDAIMAQTMSIQLAFKTIEA